MRETILRLLDWLRRGRLDRELQEELRFHQRQIETAAAADGATAEAARRQARRQLGDPLRIAEATRERWSIRWIDHLQQDVRQAVRGLRRTPGFTAAVVATLALGIGANAATVAVVDRLMFRPLDDLRHPDRVHRVYMQTLDRGRLNTTSWMTFGRFADIAAATTSFDAVAGFVERSFAVGVGESVRELPVVGVSASFFDFFDAAPAAGRFFTAGEDRAPIGAAVSVLAHSFWHSEYQGRDVIGSTLQVGNMATTIIGVAPASLVGVNDAQPAQIFVPINSIGPAYGGPDAARFAQGYDFFWGHMMARRGAGVSEEA
ncbi:MAG TPA: ABC transporter permease, partial [Vicinamibacterales bacterium]|nr:ABC transporter permease [Vicinamibacterales bacterium]